MFLKYINHNLSEKLFIPLFKIMPQILIVLTLKIWNRWQHKQTLKFFQVLELKLCIFFHLILLFIYLFSLGKISWIINKLFINYEIIISNMFFCILFHKTMIILLPSNENIPISILERTDKIYFNLIRYVKWFRFSE